MFIATGQDVANVANAAVGLTVGDAEIRGRAHLRWEVLRGTLSSVRTTARGLADDTVVVYTSDQGFFLGDHGWFDKRFIYEESLQMPFLVRYPAGFGPGVADAIASNVDFAPTFLDYAGVSTPEDMQGESFRQLVNGSTDEWRDAVYYTYYEYPSVHMVKRHYGIATDRYKLMHFYYDIDEWEMYDLEKDPSELKNVYDDPAYADVRTDLHKRLEELRTGYGDSDELDQHYLKTYLDHMEKRKQN